MCNICVCVIDRVRWTQHWKLSNFSVAKDINLSQGSL